MNEQEVKNLFFSGVEAFRQGKPKPEDRIKYLGWNSARKAQREIDDGLEMALEAYTELERGASKRGV
jgi:hypothetical protein